MHHGLFREQIPVPAAPTVERVKKWLARKWFLLGMITTLNMPGWEPEERICLGILSIAPKPIYYFGQAQEHKSLQIMKVSDIYTSS